MSSTTSGCVIIVTKTPSTCEESESMRVKNCQNNQKKNWHHKNATKWKPEQWRRQPSSHIVMQECQGQESEKVVLSVGGDVEKHPCELVSTLSTFSTKPSSRPPIRRNPQDLNNTPWFHHGFIHSYQNWQWFTKIIAMVRLIWTVNNCPWKHTKRCPDLIWTDNNCPLKHTWRLDFLSERRPCILSSLSCFKKLSKFKIVLFSF